MLRFVVALFVVMISSPALGQIDVVEIMRASPGAIVDKTGSPSIEFDVPVSQDNTVLAVSIQIVIEGMRGSEALIGFEDLNETRYTDQISIEESGSYLFDISRGILAAQRDGLDSQSFTLNFLNSDKSYLEPDFREGDVFGLVKYVYSPVRVPKNEIEYFEEEDTSGQEIPFKSTLPTVRVSPNPFNPSTTISLRLGSADMVDLGVFDIDGALIATLNSSRLGQGDHEFVWNGRDAGDRQVASGIYFYRAIVGQTVLTGKMSLLK